ncbi:MAG: dihydropteroate synthase [Calditerrivibrio sp.]|nr:dihydropteroate synthase [Calditerrivibrio sp.]
MFLEVIDSDKDRLVYECGKIGAHPYSFRATDRGIPLNIKIKGMKPAAANIVKQEAIASGIDAVVHRGAVDCSVDMTDVLICGDIRGIRILSERLDLQPFGLKEVADRLRGFLADKGERAFQCRDRLLNLKKKQMMAIVNVTPDSFSDGGRFQNLEYLENHLIKLRSFGVEVVDIGGESTRPGAESVPAEEELRRITPALEMAVSMGFIVSVDTYKSEVAKKALEMGAHIINDISGLRFDKEMAKVCGAFGAGVVLMHIKGTPKTMQNNPQYDNLLEEVKRYLHDGIEIALNSGIDIKNIMIDPGFGFGKSLEDNYRILKYLREFRGLGVPVLVGISRKSMIGNVLGKDVSQRLLGTKVAETIALLNGADVVRSHDLEETLDMLKLVNFYSEVGFRC